MKLAWRTAPLMLLLAACADKPPPEIKPASPWFEEVSAQMGIDFVHYDGRSGRKYYMETTASGGGFIDFDKDGDLDLYLVNATASPGSDPIRRPVNQLYENRGDQFVDVTAAAGVGDDGYGQGMCVGDVDSDGWPDLMVTNFGPDRLYRNRGDGTFEDWSEVTGVTDPRWSMSCAFGDLDGDGDQDLYVTRYLNFSYDNNPRCGDPVRDLWLYCRPDAFDGLPDSLYINDGSGHFTPEEHVRGIVLGPDEKGLGVILSDIEHDGDLDIFVANDATPNRLYVNDGTGHFKDRALLAGLGVNGDGMSESCMGVDLGDADGDGRDDLIVTNFSMETNTLYKNRGELKFQDISPVNGIGAVSVRTVAWGVRFIDYDNDGDLDLALANGAVDDNTEAFDQTLSSAQRNNLLSNDGSGQFTDVTDRSGPAWAAKRITRGLAVGDIDNDGRLDLLFTNTNDQVDLLLNRLETGHHWLGMRLAGPPSNPLSIGARVRHERNGLVQVQEVRSGGSFLSQGDIRIHFGLGKDASPGTLTITWPNGCLQHIDDPVIDRYQTIEYRPASSVPGTGSRRESKRALE